MITANLLRCATALGLTCAWLTVFVACGAADSEATDGSGSGSAASTVFVPGEAPPMPPLPPGAGPHGPNPNPTTTADAKPPKDATGTDAPGDGPTE